MEGFRATFIITIIIVVFYLIRKRIAPSTILALNMAIYENNFAFFMWEGFIHCLIF